jgi:hypothetical protein
MAFEVVGAVLASLASPLAATVVKSAASWINKDRAAADVQKSAEEILVETLTGDDLKRTLAALGGKGVVGLVGLTGPGAENEIDVAEGAQDLRPKTAPAPKRSKQPKGKSAEKAQDTAKVDAANVVTAAREIVVSPVFKLVFLTVVFLTVGSGIAATVMAFAGDGSHPNEQAVFESMNTAWKLGLGAIFGLLGGKAA